MPKFYLRIDLNETLPESAGSSPDSFPAVEELFDFLVNEFNNQGISAHLQIVEEQE